MKHFGHLPILLQFLLLAAMAHAQAKIAGIVTTESERVPLCTVQLWRDSILVQQCLTNMDGEYAFEGLKAGKYVVEARVDELSAESEVILSTSETHLVGLFLEPPLDQPGYWTIVPNCNDCHTIENCVHPPYHLPPYSENRYLYGPFVNGRRINDLAALTPGMVQLDQGDPLFFRGSRSECNLTFIDGRKVRGSDEIPMAMLEQVTVIGRAVPAEYGDATGAFIIVTTQDPTYICRVPEHVRPVNRMRHSY